MTTPVADVVYAPACSCADAVLRALQPRVGVGSSSWVPWQPEYFRELAVLVVVLEHRRRYALYWALHLRGRHVLTVRESELG